MSQSRRLIFCVSVVILQILSSAAQAVESTTPPTQTPDGKSVLRSKKIQHPGAKDGLYLIDEEGVYHYKVPTKSGRDYSLFFRFVSVSSPEIVTNVNGSDLDYSDFYGSSDMTGIDVIYEWQPFKGFGKAGIQLGGGISVSSGRGYFASGDTREPLEGFTLFSLPLFAGVIYRFEFVNRQWFVPYVTGGLIYNGLLEYRDDGQTNLVGAPAGYGGGGLLINLTALNKRLAFIMDREYGFSSLWLSAEFRRNQSFNEDLDISANQISIGIGADY